MEKITFKQRLGGDERVLYVNSLENAMQPEGTPGRSKLACIWGVLRDPVWLEQNELAGRGRKWGQKNNRQVMEEMGSHSKVMSRGQLILSFEGSVWILCETRQRRTGWEVGRPVRSSCKDLSGITITSINCPKGLFIMFCFYLKHNGHKK